MRIKAYGDQEVKVIGSIILHMYTKEKADRVTWQVTDTTGVLILGKSQAKCMNYISYPEIHAPQEQPPVSQNSLKSTDYIHSLETTQHSSQTNPNLTGQNSTALHRRSTERQPRQNQVLHMNQGLHKSLGIGIQ